MALTLVLVIALTALAAMRGTRRLPGTTAETDAQSRVALAVDAAVACDLLAAVLESGASVPRALAALGESLAGQGGRELVIASRILRLGGSWDEACHNLGSPAYLEPLRPAWVEGSAPGPLLLAAAAQVRFRRSAAAREAAERLAVRLVLPLGLCLLPAFVLMGLVPVVIATGGQFFGQ